MKTLLLDLDGTMYHGTNIIPNAKKLIDYLLENNHKFYFFTNNASRTPLENAKHMLEMGYQGITPEMFFNSAMACVGYLKKHYRGNKVMMIGQAGLKEELINKGYQLVESDADYVVVGMNKHGDYQLYSQALSNLVAGAKLVGTNQDRMLLTEEGVKIGNGSVVKMLEYASGQEALITGKPTSIILNEALEYFGLSREEVLVVGDNLETDIQCGINAKVKTVFITSGVHTNKDCEELGIMPDYTIDDMLDLIEIIK